MVIYGFTNHGTGRFNWRNADHWCDLPRWSLERQCIIVIEMNVHPQKPFVSSWFMEETEEAIILSKVFRSPAMLMVKRDYPKNIPWRSDLKTKIRWFADGWIVGMRSRAHKNEDFEKFTNQFFIITLDLKPITDREIKMRWLACGHEFHYCEFRTQNRVIY